MTCFYKAVETPGEAFKLVSHKSLAVMLWENVDQKRVRLRDLLEAVDHPILERAEDQLSHFLAGTRRSCHIEPRPRRLRIPEERLGSTANASLRPDTLIREDRKSRWRSKGNPRRRCCKRQEQHTRGSVPHGLRRCLVGMCSKFLETACDPLSARTSVYA